MKGIVLQRKVDVQCWRVLGRISKAQQRTELLVLLQRASERGATNDSDVAAHLLFESQSRRTVAQRWLRIAEAYGLLEVRKSDYVLTEAGQRALASQHVFVPEQGTWTVWAANDPLLPDAVLRVDPWREPSAYDELAGEERQVAEERSFNSVPGWIRDCCGREMLAAASEGVPIRIDELQKQGERIEAEASLEISWDVDSGLVQLRGDVRGVQVDLSIPSPQLSAKQVWAHLLVAKRIAPLWDPEREALQVAFNMTKDRQRKTMQVDLPFERPDLPDLGSFEALVVPAVPLCAANQTEAEQWARWRLESGVSDYATAERFASWQSNAVVPFQEWTIRLPERQQLAVQVWSQRGEVPSPTAWHLMAAEDWRL